ncbi:MAG: response regulator [Pseudomonadota bacterium]
MSFALYRRPGGVVFLDDDPDYLEMLAEVMHPQWYVRLFVRPVACIEMLLDELVQWETDAWRQQEIINRWREGSPLVPQILQYWREGGSARFGLTQVCVVDYSMPAMSGLRVLGELTGWPGSRVLLTGRADEQLAVSAFNRGLIEQFIPKQAPEIRLRLIEAIQNLLRKPNARHEQTWRATLSREQHALLGMPAIARSLEELSQKHGWVEHVVTGAPFGVLALGSNAQVSWLQLESADKLPELAEMAESQGWDAHTVREIRSATKLIDLELQPALGAGHKPGPQPAFVMGDSSSQLHAALFQLDAAFSPGPGASYNSFIAAHRERAVQD